MLFDNTARSSSCPLLLSFLFNVNIIPATLSSSELAVVVPELGLGRRAGGWRQVPLQSLYFPFPCILLIYHYAPGCLVGCPAVRCWSLNFTPSGCYGDHPYHFFVFNR